MGNRIILNGTSYFGRGARENVITELRNRNFTKALVVTDKNLLDAHVTNLQMFLIKMIFHIRFILI